MYLKHFNLFSIHKHLHFALMFLILGLCLLHPMTAQAAGLPADMAMKENSKKADPQVQIPEDLSPNEVDAYLAGLSDEQARQVLARQLKQGTAGNSTSDITKDVAGEEDPTDQLFHKLSLGATILIDQIASFFSSEKEGSLKWQTILNRLSGGRGVGHIMLTLLIGLGVIACGIVVERLVLRLTSNLQEQIATCLLTMLKEF